MRRARSSVGRVFVWHTKGRRFESGRVHNYGGQVDGVGVRYFCGAKNSRRQISSGPLLPLCGISVNTSNWCNTFANEGFTLRSDNDEGLIGKWYTAAFALPSPEFDSR